VPKRDPHSAPIAPIAPVGPVWPEQLARLLDDGFQVPGTKWRIGIDPILGLLFPGAGDVLSGLANVALLWLALREGLPASVMLRMVINTVLDVLLGAIPVAGDLFDFFWKATRRNLELIQRHRTGKPGGIAEYLLAGALVLVMLAALAIPMVAFAAAVLWISRR
jgi:hypothetical protein